MICIELNFELWWFTFIVMICLCLGAILCGLVTTFIEFLLELSGSFRAFVAAWPLVIFYCNWIPSLSLAIIPNVLSHTKTGKHQLIEMLFFTEFWNDVTPSHYIVKSWKTRIESILFFMHIASVTSDGGDCVRIYTIQSMCYQFYLCGYSSFSFPFFLSVVRESSVR